MEYTLLEQEDVKNVKSILAKTNTRILGEGKERRSSRKHYCGFAERSLA